MTTPENARAMHTFDGRTGECIDCGAQRSEIDDNIVTSCEKKTGPHRLAIIALKRREGEIDSEIRSYEISIMRYRESLIAASDRIADLKRSKEAICGSLDLLQQKDAEQK